MGIYLNINIMKTKDKIVVGFVWCLIIF